MIVRELTSDDIAHVLRNMRAVDRREVFAIRFHDDVEKLIEEYEAMRPFDVLSPAFALAPGAPAIAIASVLLAAPRVGLVRMMATDDWPAIAPWVHRWMVRHWFRDAYPRLFNAVECRSWAEHPFSHGWLQRLGFRREGYHPGRGSHGEAFVTYAWLNPEIAPTVEDAHVHGQVVRRQQRGRAADGNPGGASQG